MDAHACPLKFGSCKSTNGIFFLNEMILKQNESYLPTRCTVSVFTIS